jgi:hypothetical protein
MTMLGVETRSSNPATASTICQNGSVSTPPM